MTPEQHHTAGTFDAWRTQAATAFKSPQARETRRRERFVSYGSPDGAEWVYDSIKAHTGHPTSYYVDEAVKVTGIKDVRTTEFNSHTAEEIIAAAIRQTLKGFK